MHRPPPACSPVIALIGTLAVAAPSASAQVAINEVHFHPACTVSYTPCPDAPAEFIEVHNAGASAVDLSGWRFLDGVEYAFATGSILAPGAFWVIADDASGFATVFGFAPDDEWAGKLSNSGENVRLADAGNVTVDEVHYGDGSDAAGEWFLSADGEGDALQLMDAQADNARSRFWAPAAPTPGAINSVAAQTPPPGVENFAFTTWPLPGEAVVVSADVYGATTVQLRYRVGYGGANQTIAMTSVDGVAYTATVPAAALSAGDLVRLQVRLDGQRRAPLASDTIDWVGTTVQDPAVNADVPVLEWFTSDASYNAGYAEQGDTFYDGVLAVEGVVYDNVGFRIRGNIARTDDWTKRNWKMKLPPHHSLVINGISYAIDTMDLQGGYADATRVREAVGQTACAEMGLLQSEVQHVRVLKNGSYFGLHTLQEHPEAGFLQARDLDRASLYQGAWSWLFTYHNGPANPPSEAVTFENWDIPEYINIAAAASIIQNNDFAHNNFYWWYDLDEHERWEGMVWDFDLSQGVRITDTNPLETDIATVLGNDYTNPSTPYRDSIWSRWYNQAPVFRHVLTNPVFRAMYLRRVQTLSTQWHASGQLDTLMRDTAAAIANEWALDTAAWGFGGGLGSYTYAAALDEYSDDWLTPFAAHIAGGGPDGDLPGPQPASPNVLLVVDPAPANPKLESVALQNQEAVAIDVSGWHLTGSIDVVLPPGAVLPALASAYVVDDDTADGFRSVTTDLHVLASYGADLNDAGGHVTLEDDTGQLIDGAAWGAVLNPGLILNEWNAVSSGEFLPAGDARLGTVLGNGGDWFELVVTEDHLDARGWALEIRDESVLDATLTLSNDVAWSDLRAGTIITIAEGVLVGENNSLYPEDASTDPFTGDWWMHVVSGSGASGALITATNFKVSNDDWQLTVYDASAVRRFGPAGEGVGALSGGGISASEIGELEADPSAAITPSSLYDDGDDSTFGLPNGFDSGAQAFGMLRDTDDDGQVDDVDPCPLDPGDDSDSDGICDGVDICAGADDNIDTDMDTVPDGCDACPLDATGDSDMDGACDSDDVCPGFDDAVNTDGDAAPDGCDVCPLDALDDSDMDGACDSDDICPGFDDAANTDGDAAPDGCDVCPLDALDDSDMDGACDSDDICPGFDDAVNTDGDALPDGCDICPLDATDDSDMDGACDSDDICPGFDDTLNADGDAFPDGCDVCPADALNDEDGDGVCAPEDICPGFPDGDDRDSDGTPDACDVCPDDVLDDSDTDGVCDSDDVCPGFDDTVDTDEDGVPNGCDDCSSPLDSDDDGQPDDCDPCPDDALDDSDADGTCDSVDTCAGYPDGDDDDDDGVPDGCDACMGHDDANDEDGDGLPDGCDAPIVVLPDAGSSAPDAGDTDGPDDDAGALAPDAGATSGSPDGGSDDAPPEGCACDAASSADPFGVLAFGVLGVFFTRRRTHRRRPRRMNGA